MKKIDFGRIGTFLSQTVEIRKSFWFAFLIGMVLFILVLVLTTYYSMQSVFADSKEAARNGTPGPNCTENVTQKAVHNGPRLLYCLNYVKTLTSALNKNADHCINREKLKRDKDVLPSDHPLYESLVPAKWVCVLICDTPMASCMYGEKCVAVKTDEFEIFLEDISKGVTLSKVVVPLKGKRLVMGGKCLCNSG